MVPPTASQRRPAMGRGGRSPAPPASLFASVDVCRHCRGDSWFQRLLWWLSVPPETWMQSRHRSSTEGQEVLGAGSRHPTQSNKHCRAHTQSEVRSGVIQRIHGRGTPCCCQATTRHVHTEEHAETPADSVEEIAGTRAHDDGVGAKPVSFFHGLPPNGTIPPRETPKPMWRGKKRFQTPCSKRRACTESQLLPVHLLEARCQAKAFLLALHESPQFVADAHCFMYRTYVPSVPVQFIGRLSVPSSRFSHFASADSQGKRSEDRIPIHRRVWEVVPANEYSYGYKWKTPVSKFVSKLTRHEHSRERERQMVRFIGNSQVQSLNSDSNVMRGQFY